MLNYNEKRPERVLSKGAHQEVTCPNCKQPVQASNGQTTAQCRCGQSLNWGLRKA